MLDLTGHKAEAAPFFGEVAEGPDDARAHWLLAADGIRIRVGYWGPEAPKGTVLLFPGRTEYIEKYGRAARDLLDRGFATVAIDWRGQGLADRLQPNRAIGHVGSFADYQKDVRAVLAHVREQGLPEPFHLLGHSMGGCIGLRALTEGLPVKAAAFTAPMWGIQLSTALRPLAWGLSSLSRPLRFGHLFAPGQTAETYINRIAFELNTLTSDPEMFDHIRGQIAAHPDLGLGGPSLHWLNESLREMRTLSALPSPDVPALAFLGGDEAIVDPERIRARMARWPGAELVEFEGARHELMIERPEIRQVIFDRVAELFSAAAG